MSVLLSNGKQMPLISLGTYKTSEEDLNKLISIALDTGYRSFDTASCCMNETILYKILEKELFIRNMSREDVYLITKLKPKDHGYDNAIEAMKKSSRNLGGYIDMYLIHWPGVAKCKPNDEMNKKLRCESWNAMTDMYTGAIGAIGATGASADTAGTSTLVRGIGVSNYHIHHLEELCNLEPEPEAGAEPEPEVYDYTAPSKPNTSNPNDNYDHNNSHRPHIKPMVNQIEIHPTHHPIALISYCRQHEIQVQAYAPFGSGGLLKKEFLDLFPKCREIAMGLRLGLGLDSGVERESAPGNKDEGDKRDKSDNDTGSSRSSGSSSLTMDTSMEHLDTDIDTKMALCTVYLSWLLQHGYLAVPKATTPDQVVNNYQCIAQSQCQCQCQAGSTSVPVPLANSNSNCNCSHLSVEEVLYLDSIQSQHTHKYCWDSEHIL